MFNRIGRSKVVRVSAGNILLVGLFLTITACGGGSHDDVPDACKSYCSLACSKIGVCEDFSRSQIDDCADNCVQTIDDNGEGSSASCQSASSTIVASSCSDLERIVGLRSQEFKTLSSEDQSQAGSKLSEKICAFVSSK